MHHPRADTDRLYVSRKDGGRGLQQVEAAYKASILNTACYLEKAPGKFIALMRSIDHELPRYKSVSKQADKFIHDLNINDSVDDNLDKRWAYKRKLALNIKNHWKSKAMHGQFVTEILDNNAHIDKENTVKWLTRSDVKGETESLIIAAQDQAINTKYHSRRILGQNVDSKCRICRESEETIYHVMSACPVLAQREYISRHDRVAKALHHKICQNHNIEVTRKWYEHDPPQVINKDHVTILWNQPVRTDRTILANKPDIIIKNTQNNMCFIIDVAIPNDYNMRDKEAEKTLKYRDLSIEINRMWKMKTEILPIVIGATGTVTKNLKETLQKLGGNIQMQQLQTIAVFGTAHIIRKVLG